MSPSRFLSQLAPRPLSWVVFAAIFGGAAGCLGYLYAISIRHTQFEMRRHVRDHAETAAGLVDVALHERLTSPAQTGSEEYRLALAPLIKFQKRHDSIQYLWTVRVAFDDRQTFVLETAVDPEIRQRQLALGRSQDVLDFLGPNTAETPVGAASLAMLRRGEAMVFSVPYVDDHGTYIEARAPLLDAAGKFVGYVGVDYALDSYNRQVNEVRLAGGMALLLALLLGLLLAKGAYHMREQTRAGEAALAEQRDAARKANEAKGELLRIASHDLKNPLAAIAGMSGLLAKMMQARPGSPTLKDDLEVIETIHGSAQHMSEIVRGILMGEGLEQGGLPFAPAPADLSKLAADVVKFNRLAAQKKSLTLREQITPGLTATADAKLLREAFDNYLSNAVKYSPPGKGIGVTLRPLPEGAAEFSVQDEGPGLSAADHALLFQKFKKLTPRPTAGESSTGLGLSIVKTIAGLHGGSVGCDSEPGCGARFWLRLPARPPGNSCSLAAPGRAP